ncbi:hypothetical protein, partial [Acinetobacter baumannii]|uniref:hypothetical protein n=1 Tax=Acinetobacter baumannii TaxID=470 RepID=UPI001C0915AA
HKAHVIEQAVAPRRGQLAQPLQHAVGKGRRAQPATAASENMVALSFSGGGFSGAPAQATSIRQQRVNSNARIPGTPVIPRLGSMALTH